MSNLSLPPRLSGNTRATLELRIEALLLTTFSAKQKIRKSNVKVFVRWWGQSLKEAIYFSPRVVQSLGLRRDSSPSSRGIRVAVFKVLVSEFVTFNCTYKEELNNGLVRYSNRGHC